MHETLADYEKALVDRLKSMETTDGAVIALAIATLIFIIVQVVIVTSVLNKQADSKPKPGQKYWSLMQDGICSDSEYEFSINEPTL